MVQPIPTISTAPSVPSNSGSNPRPKAFVLLAHGFGATSRNQRWKNGQIIGLNEPFANSYHNGSGAGNEVIYCEDRDVAALRQQIRSFVDDADERMRLCTAAQARMRSDIGSVHYARRHADLSFELLKGWTAR